MKSILKTAALAAAFGAVAGMAQAVPLNLADGHEDGDAWIDASGSFRFDPANLTNGSGDGSCAALGGVCIQLNAGATTTMTSEPAGAAFNLNSIGFVLDGMRAEITLLNTSIDANGVLIVSLGVGDEYDGMEVEHNDLFTLDLAGMADGVTSILFDNTGTGNLRIGSIDADLVSAVPLPAAGLLLLSGLAGLGYVSRRRKAA